MAIVSNVNGKIDAYAANGLTVPEPDRIYNLRVAGQPFSSSITGDIIGTPFLPRRQEATASSTLVDRWSVGEIFSTDMEIDQVVLDADASEDECTAKRARVSRSVLIREAPREHLKHLRAGEVEARGRRGYRRCPDAAGDGAAWERVASWPE